MSNLEDRFYGERTVKRDSERSRRDRLNESFVALSRLLPSFDESKVYSKLEIINQSRRFICELVEQNRRLLSAESGKENVQNGKIVYLTERVRYLLNRNHQLSAMLREAKIRIPSHEDMVKIAKSKRMLAKKLKNEAAAAAASAATAATTATAATATATTTAASGRVLQSEGAPNEADASSSATCSNADAAQSTSELATTATLSAGSGSANSATTVIAATTTTSTSGAKLKKSTNDSASDKSTNSSDAKKKLQVPEKRTVPVDGAPSTGASAATTAAVAGPEQTPAAVIVVKKVPVKVSQKSTSVAIQKIDPRYKILLPRNATPKVPISKLGSEKSLHIEPHKMSASNAVRAGVLGARGMKKVRRRSDEKGRSAEGNSGGESGGTRTDNGGSGDGNWSRDKVIPRASLAKKLKTIKQKIDSDRNFEDEIISQESDLQKIKQHLQKNQKLLKDHYSKNKKTPESVHKSPGKKQSGHKNYTIDSLCSAQNQPWDSANAAVAAAGTSMANGAAAAAVAATAPAAAASTTSTVSSSNMNAYQRSSVITREGSFGTSHYDLANDLLQTLGGAGGADSLGHHANAANEPSSALSPTANFLSHFPLVSSGGATGTTNVANHGNSGMMLPAITTASTTSTTFGHDIWSTATTAPAAAIGSTATGHMPNNDHLLGHNQLPKTATSSLENNFCSLTDQLNSGDKFYMDLARNSTNFRNMQSLASTEKKLPKDNFLDHFIDREFPQFNEFGLSINGAGGGGGGGGNGASSASGSNVGTSTKSTTQNFFSFTQPHQNQPLPHHQQQQQHASPPKQPKLTNSKPVNWMTTPPHAKNTSTSSSSSSSSALNPFAAPFSNSATQNATATSAPATSALNNSSSAANNSLDFLFQPFGCSSGGNSAASRPSFSLPASNSHSGLKDLVAETSFMETGPSSAAAPSSAAHLIEWSSSSHKYQPPHHYQSHTGGQHRSSASVNSAASAPVSASSSLLMPNDSLQSSLDLGLMPQLPSLSSHQTNATTSLSTNTGNTFNNFSVSHLMDNNSMQLGLNSYQQQSQQQHQQQQPHLQHQQSSKQTTFFNPVHSASSSSGHKSSSSNSATSASASSSLSSSANRKNWIDLNFQPHKSFQYSAESLISSHPPSSGISTNAPMLSANDLWTPATASSASSYQNQKMALNHQTSSSTAPYNSNNGFAPFAFQTTPAAPAPAVAGTSAASNTDFHDVHLSTNVFDFETCIPASALSLHHSMIAP